MPIYPLDSLSIAYLICCVWFVRCICLFVAFDYFKFAVDRISGMSYIFLCTGGGGVARRPTVRKDRSVSRRICCCCFFDWYQNRFTKKTIIQNAPWTILDLLIKKKEKKVQVTWMNILASLEWPRLHTFNESDGSFRHEIAYTHICISFRVQWTAQQHIMLI